MRNRKLGTIHRSQRRDLPDGFENRLVEMFGAGEARRLLSTFVARPPSFRINSLKFNHEEVLHALAECAVKTDRIPWYRFGVVAPHASERELRKLSLYRDGAIYLQSVASMLPVVALDPRPGERVLDLAAAPGSKTGQIAMAMACRGELVAVEVHKIRFQRLSYNMKLLGASEKSGFLELLCADGRKCAKNYEGYFDRVLLDAPCSGEARFVRGDPRTFGAWNEERSAEEARRQFELLQSGWQALKPGGILVYATCTLAPEENEMVIGRFLAENHCDASLEAIDLPGLRRLPALSAWRGYSFAMPPGQVLRVYPTETTESFFVARLRKR